VHLVRLKGKLAAQFPAVIAVKQGLSTWQGLLHGEGCMLFSTLTNRVETAD
jgi:hypothetical protein